MKSIKLLFLSLVLIAYKNIFFAQDPAIISNIFPVNGCDKTNSEMVRITIMNQASSPATFVPIAPNVITAHYSVDGGPTVSQTITVGLITYGATYIFTFTTPADLSACGPHTINTWLTTSGGNTNLTNDTKNWTIQNDCTIIPGTVTTNATVCQGANSGTLNLSGWSNGTITSWEYSTNSGASWLPIGNVSTSENYTNLTTNTDYRVQLEGGFCPDAISGIATITVQAPPVAGVVNSSATLCEAAATGTLNLVGSVGSVNYWESSTDGIAWTNIPNNTTTQSYTGLTQDTWYRAQIEGGVCPDVVASEAVLTINPNTVPGTLSMSQTICEGSSVVLTLAGYTGAITGWEYSLDGLTWSSISNTSNTFTTPALSVSTRYRVKVKSGVCNELYSNEAIITVDPTPLGGTISSSANICEGSSGVLTLVGYSGLVNFWETSLDGLTWTNVANSTNTLNYTGLTNTTYYRAQVEGGTCADVYATIAILNVDPNTVSGTLSMSQTICEGSSVVLTLAGYTGAITGWEYSLDGLTWSSISNTSNTFTTPALSVSTRYRVKVKSGVCNELYSNDAIITVNPIPVGGAVASSSTICEGNSGSLTLIGNSGAVNFWETSLDGISWTNIANTTNTFNYSGLTATTYYRAQIEGGACADVFATQAVLTVDPTTVPGILSMDQSICEGNNVVLSLAGEIGNILFWETSIDGGTTWNTIANTTSTYTSPTLTQTTKYRVNVQSGVCSQLISNEVLITVDPLPIGGVVNSSATICSTTPNGTLNLIGSSGVVNFWEASNDGVTWTTIPNTTTSYAFSGLTADTWFRVQIEGGACSDVYATEAVITLSPATASGTLNADQTICEGSTATMNLIGNSGSITDWEMSTDNIVWSSIGNTTANYTTPVLNSTTYYRAIVQNGSCPSSNSNVVMITVNPAPVAGNITGSATLCQSSATGTLNLVGSVGTILDWEYSIDNGLTWITLGNSTSTYSYTSLTDTTWYRALISATSCPTVYSNSAVVNILQDSYGGILTQNTTICQKDTVTLTLAGAIGNTNIWEESTDNVSWSPITTNQTTWDVSPMVTKYYRVTVSNGTCPSSVSNSITITVNPSPLVNAGADVSITIGDTTTLSGFGGDIALWSPSLGLTNPNIPNPQAFPTTTTAYIYTGIGLNGCSATDTVLVIVNPLLGIDIKNLITANKDGFNDFWILEGVQDFPNTEVHVFDIYGAEVYSNMDYKNDWDGSYRGNKLPNGNYYYVVKVQGESELRKGNLTILGNE